MIIRYIGLIKITVMASINCWAQIQNEEREWEKHVWVSSSQGSFFQYCGEHLVSKTRKKLKGWPKLSVYKAEKP